MLLNNVDAHYKMLTNLRFLQGLWPLLEPVFIEVEIEHFYLVWMESKIIIKKLAAILG